MELQNRNYNNLEEGKSDDLTYNPNQTPPDLDLARKHGKANKVYLSNQNGYQNVQDIETCSCCGLPVEGKLIPLTADLKELYHLGESCVQYFQLIKHSIGILVVFLLVSGYYNIITNYYGTDCKTPDEDSSYNYCPESVIISFSIANKRNHPDQLKTQLILNFLGVLASLLYSIYGIYQVRKTKHEFGETLTPADYTIEIDHIPPELEATEEQITTWLEGLGTSDNPIKVIRVLLTRCPDNDSTAYVSFEKVQHAKYIQSKFKICSPSFLGKSVFVKSAPEPMSIIQENLNFSRSRSSSCLKLIGYIAVLRACNFIGEHIPTAKEWTIYFFGEEFFLVRQFQIWSTIIIAVIIILVSLTIVFLSRFNRFKSQNAESCCTFLALFVIYFSTLCGPLCSPNNFDRIDKTFENVGWIIIICPLLVPLLSIFDFSYFYKLYCRFSRLNRVTQEEAHPLFEGSNMDLGTKYAVVMNLQMIASFCAPIMPLALISAIIGLILCYWADKYTLLRRHTLPRPIDSSVIEQMIWFCFLSSYMFLTSTFLYFYHFEYGEAFPDETYWLLWAAFGICVASPLILEPVMKEKKFSTQVTETRTFNEAKQDFVVDYNITEPITTVEFFRRSFSARAGNSQE